MRSIRVLVILVLLVLVSACTGPRVVCNKPYIRVGTECCLDYNDNKVCDKDESMIIGSAIDVLSKKSDNATEATADTTADEEDTLQTEETSEDINIAITDAYWSTMYPEIDQEIELTIEFENTGDDIEEFKYIVKIYKGEKVEKEDIYEHSTALESGKSTKAKDIEYTFSEEGDYNAKIFIEGFEDNAKEIAFYVSELKEETADEEDLAEETNEATPGCLDHDDGRDYTTSSYCEDSTGKHFDSCYRDDVVMEYYCDSLVGHMCVHTFEFNCNCENGRCI